jgi:hypothetical protein
MKVLSYSIDDKMYGISYSINDEKELETVNDSEI